jgi:hypothetical protein
MKYSVAFPSTVLVYDHVQTMKAHLESLLPLKLVRLRLNTPLLQQLTSETMSRGVLFL